MFFNYHGCPYANETLSANIYNVLHTHKHFCCYLYDKNVYTYIKYIVFQAVFIKYIFYTKARRIRDIRSIMAYLRIDSFMERLCVFCGTFHIGEKNVIYPLQLIFKDNTKSTHNSVKNYRSKNIDVLTELYNFKVQTNTFQRLQSI